MINSKILLGALITCGVMLVIIFCIFLYLVYKRLKEIRTHSKLNAYIQEYEKSWYNYLVRNVPLDHRPYNQTILMGIDRIFVSYMTTLSNEDIQHRISNYAALNMQNYYIKRLKSSNKSVRINVLQRGLLLQLKFLVPIIEQNLRRKHIGSMEEYLLMLRVISKYNRNLFFAHIYKPRLPLQDYEYKVLLSNIDESYIEYFKNHFHGLPIRLKLALLDFLSLSTNLNNAYLSFYERLLKSECVEIRIRSLKAIAAFGMVSDLTLYKGFVESSDWEERLMLAKILRFVVEEEAYTYLQNLMLDPNWQVRKQAALSLVNMPKGQKILMQLIDRNEDSYAADMAREVMKLG